MSKSAANRVFDHLGPSLALRERSRFRQDAVLIVDRTLVPARDHAIAEQSKSYRYSTNHQVVIDADSRLVVVVGQPLPGNRNDAQLAWVMSGGVGHRSPALVAADPHGPTLGAHTVTGRGTVVRPNGDGWSR